MFSKLVEEIRFVVEGRTKAQQYHGMLMQNPEPGQAKRWGSHYKDDAAKLAKSAKSKANKSNSTAGETVSDWRKDTRSAQGSDNLALRSMVSTRRRQADIRSSAKKHGWVPGSGNRKLP